MFVCKKKREILYRVSSEQGTRMLNFNNNIVRAASTKILILWNVSYNGIRCFDLSQMFSLEQNTYFDKFQTSKAYQNKTTGFILNKPIKNKNQEQEQNKQLLISLKRENGAIYSIISLKHCRYNIHLIFLRHGKHNDKICNHLVLLHSCTAR